MGTVLSCAIVDDDAVVLRTLRSFILRAANELGISADVTCFQDPFDLIEDYDSGFDLIFLDIEMPQMDGMSLAHQIREVDENVCLVFVTNMAQFALKGYEVSAADFIVKPVTYETFAFKFRRALRNIELHREHDFILKADDGRLVRAAVSTIAYIEKNGNYLIFHVGEDTFRERGSLAARATELEAYKFAQINSGCFVNLRRVDSFDTAVVIVDGEALPLSRRRRTAFVDTLMDYLGEA